MSWTRNFEFSGSAFGFKIYQNAMGDAAKLSVRKDGETLQESYLCVGDALQIMGTPLYLQLQSILPDYETGADGHTRSGFAYLIYVGDEFYTMSVRAEGEQIADFKPYEVFFSEPCSYTLLQIKRDRFTPLALVGGVVTLLGLLLAFYLQTRKLWARREEDGTWTVFGSSPKGGALFADRVKDAVEQLKNQS